MDLVFKAIAVKYSTFLFENEVLSYKVLENEICHSKCILISAWEPLLFLNL